MIQPHRTTREIENLSCFLHEHVLNSWWDSASQPESLNTDAHTDFDA